LKVPPTMEVPNSLHSAISALCRYWLCIILCANVQDFWRYWNNFQIEDLPKHSKLIFLKHGLAPEMTDPCVNKKGGSWVRCYFLHFRNLMFNKTNLLHRFCLFLFVFILFFLQFCVLFIWTLLTLRY
jgi:hypothetical protein